jgi:hypothetical protein
MITERSWKERFYQATNAGITGLARNLYAWGELTWDEAKELKGNPDD